MGLLLRAGRKECDSYMPSRPRQIDSLTPLRGIAALLVVVFHINAMTSMQNLGELLPGSSILGRGYLWVDFFFVLSGFIITHVYGTRFTSGLRRRDIKEFLVARFSRLYPLHLFALGTTLLIYLCLYARMPAPKTGGDYSAANLYAWSALPLHLLWLNGFGFTKLTWNVPDWSVAAEWWTYLLAIPLFGFMNRGVSKRTILIPVCCLLLLWAWTSHAEVQALSPGIIHAIIGFIVGICLYQLYNGDIGKRQLSSDFALLGAVLLTLIVLHFPHPAFFPAAPPAMYRVHPLTPYLDVASLPVFALLILCAAYNHQLGYRILNLRPLRYLGDISFSIYLMQGIGLTIFAMAANAWRGRHPVGPMGVGDKLLLCGGATLACVAVAAMTYRWVEVPARGWLRRKLSPETG